MNHKIRFLSALLAMILLLLPLSPLSHDATAQNNVRAASSGATGACTWSLIGSSQLSIRGSGAMANYTADSPAPWGTGLSMVFIDEGVTVIGDYAFAGCTALPSINLPGTLTTIGAHAFENCTGLAFFPLTSTFVSNIGDYAFAGCSGFTLANLPESTVTVGEGAFNSCTSLILITLPAGLESLATNAFVGCSSLEQISVDGENPYFSDKEGILMNRDQTRLLCYPAGKNVTSYHLPETVTAIGENAFHSTGVQSIVFSPTLQTVEEAAFENCTALTDVYFVGSAKEWSRITIEARNEQLLAATLHTDYCASSPSQTHIYDDEDDLTCAHCSYERAPILQGDLNEDGSVTSDDAIYLLYHSLLGEERYPLNQPCDFNQDQAVTSDDAIYLLYHTLLGAERYPLS